MSGSRYHIEILTPKQNSEDLEGDLERFGEKVLQIVSHGHIVTVPDNPMGHPHFQITEVIGELELDVPGEQLLVHVNTFHTKADLDSILRTAADAGEGNLLAISGDGGERLAKLQPEALGFSGKSVTAVELLEYIHREYPGAFKIGVAYNPYEPQEHELEKLHRKVQAGASFVITQPIIGYDPRVKAAEKFGLPVIIDAWMSRKLYLLSECIGYDVPDDAPYDPIENLITLRRNYPNHGFYFALLSFKNQLPVLREIIEDASSQVPRVA